MRPSFFRCFLNRGISACPLAPMITALNLAVVLHLGGSTPPQNVSSAPSQTVTTQEKEIAALEPNKPVKQTLTGAEVHRYRVKMQKAQSATIRVEQQGINVLVQLLGSDSAPVVEVDDEIGKQGTEKLDFVAENDGTYTVLVKPKLKIASGAYEITLSEVRAATQQDRTFYEVAQLRTKGNSLLNAGKAEEALPLAQRALALAQGILGPDAVFVALLTRDLAWAACQSGKTADCKAGYEQALHVLTAELGEEHPQTIITKRAMGSTYVNLGDFSKADQLLRQALESAERTLGPEDPFLATALNSLGVLHLHLADFVSADREFRRGVTILEKAGLTEDPRYIGFLENMALLYISNKKLDDAQTYLERALLYEEKTFGSNSSRVEHTLANLGVVAKKKKDYAAAEKYYLRALAISGPVTPTLSNLGNVYSSEGNYQKALETHLRVLGMLDNTPSPITLRRMELEAITGNYTALGDFENANKTQSQLESALESEAALKLAIGSERQKLAYLESVAPDLDDAISLNLQLEPESSDAASLAATALLRRKGRVLDALTDALGTLRKHSEPKDQELFDQLKETTSQLAQVALNGPQKQPAEQYRNALQELQERKERLENTISHQNEQFRAEVQPVTLEAVQTSIPADSALVLFGTYRPSNPKAQTSAEQYGAPRYAAYILRRSAEPKGIDLGDAKANDGLIGKLRAALRDPNGPDIQQMTRAVTEKVFHPIDALVAEKTHLLISPDGQLDLIPFEALVDEQGHFLIERYSITYLTTGRDLLRMQVPRPSKNAPVLVADPLFGEPNENLVANAATPSTKAPIARNARRSVTTGADFASLYFAPLAGTKAEARSIQALFPEARVLTGEQASESALEALNAPEILHIATHGFFLQDSAQGKEGNNAASSPENPLLRSGLALSGANLSQDSKGRGILTALQASNLNLWGTKLVTLSACDTGVGEVRNGEGVYGLRRAFFLAGTESLVMSLWPVSDYVTRELMTQYYAGLKKGLGRGEALRQAQLAMLKRKGRQHPFYWASFIQSGEWANLDGKR